MLPEGEHRDLWVVDGLISTEPVRDAETIATAGWILPGLVDAHCHVGLESTGAVPDDRAEEHAVADRAAGALLLRDAGSPADTRWMDEREDLPKIIRAGRHIARPMRYLRNFAEEVEPDALVAEVERQAGRGDGWVKLVGDWIDRDVGDLVPLWPADTAAAAIERAHQLGVRVTAHVFGEQALAELLDAGIDGIEHGTGMTDETIARMAERQVALVPTLLQLANFESYAAAGEARYPTYAKHIRHLAQRQQVVVRRGLRGGGADLRRYRRRRLPAPRADPAGDRRPRPVVPGRLRTRRRVLAGPSLARPPRHSRPGCSGRLRDLRRGPAPRPERAACAGSDCAARQAGCVKLRWCGALALALGFCSREHRRPPPRTRR